LADDIITEKHLDIKRAPVPGLAFTPKILGTPWKELSLREIVHRSVVTVEREVLIQALKYTRGNKAKAARLLQIDYKTIHTKLNQFGINRSGGGSHD
jgi:two-component system nitrogen regulation response regulator GlnG